jgi:hypothetical protein
MLVRANALLFDRLDLTDHERVAYERGHNQRTSERRRGVGQWGVPFCRSTIKLMLVNTRNTWSRYVCDIRATLPLKPSQWAGYSSDEDR